MMETKVNYQAIALKTVEGFDGAKKKLLFHVCCGPCSCYPLLFLAPYFDITIYYANSNIYPKQEYDHRLAELKRLLECYKKDKGIDIALVVPPYDNEAYTAKLAPLAHLGEFSERCFLCYRLRMEEAYDYAEEHGYDYFTTVMTVSRQKNAQKLNEIGLELEKKHPHTKYFLSDFKKNRGLEIGTEIRKQYDLYNQDYCGCVYSYQEALVRRKKGESHGQEEQERKAR